jgi:hypothetical protein
MHWYAGLFGGHSADMAAFMGLPPGMALMGGNRPQAAPPGAAVPRVADPAMFGTYPPMTGPILGAHPGIYGQPMPSLPNGTSRPPAQTSSTILSSLPASSGRGSVSSSIPPGSQLRREDLASAGAHVPGGQSSKYVCVYCHKNFARSDRLQVCDRAPKTE